MKCGHLFNGIGGFALAAHWMGWENVMHCEIDPFCNRVMNYHFPNSIQHEDIRNTDFTIYREKLDLLTGGWPCQPVSTAGKRLGKEDVRYLWPHNIRAVREIQPRIVVGENVRGLTNWQGGILFDEVQADLEAEGYEVLPFLLPAAGVNAPHRRDRIWFIAHSRRFLGNRRQDNGSGESEYHRQNDQRQETANKPKGLLTPGLATHSNSDGHRRNDGLDKGGCKAGATEGEEQWEERDEIQRERNGSIIGGVSATDWRQFPAQSPVCNRNDGLSLGLARISVPGKGRRRLLSPVESYGRWRKESIKALGNAIVPQVALQIFKAIQAYAQPPLTPNP